MIRFLKLKDPDRIFPDPDRGGAPFPREGENKQITPFWFRMVRDEVFDSFEERKEGEFMPTNNPMGNRTPEEFEEETRHDAKFVPKEAFADTTSTAPGLVGNAPGTANPTGPSKLRKEIGPLSGSKE